MEKKKKVKKSKKAVKKKKDPYSVFDSKRRDLKSESIKSKEREELIRQDKIKLAKRYEAIRLYDESIKYYKQVGMEEEAARVERKKTDLYLAKAEEFEAGGRYAEAAELYERLEMADRADEMRDKGGVKPLPPLDLDSRVPVSEEPEEIQSPKLESSKSARWEMPNVDMEAMGQDSTEKFDPTSGSKPTIDNTKELESPVDETIPLQTSENIVKEVEAERESSESAEERSTSKPFNICPYCGEKLNLPKQPKFCPYCKEAFQ